MSFEKKESFPLGMRVTGSHSRRNREYQVGYESKPISKKFKMVPVKKSLIGKRSKKSKFNE